MLGAGYPCEPQPTMRCTCKGAKPLSTLTVSKFRHKMQLLQGAHTGLTSRHAAPQHAAASRVLPLCRSSPAASRPERGDLQVVASTASDAKAASEGFFVIDAPSSIGERSASFTFLLSVYTPTGQDDRRCDGASFVNVLQEMQTLCFKCRI